MEEQTKEPTKRNPVEAGEEIASDYANNVYFIPNIWDLKILFGELGTAGREIDWHTSITLPWAQAKLMAYYLQINIASHESRSGPIKVPSSMTPSLPPPIAEADKDNPRIHALLQFIMEQRKTFLEGMK